MNSKEPLAKFSKSKGYTIKNLKVSFIGLGAYAVKRLAALEKYRDLEVEAYFDLKQNESINSRQKEIKFFDDLDLLINSTQSDLYIISSPNHIHYNHIKYLLENGRNILCEKPLVLNANEVSKIETYWEKSSSQFLKMSSNLEYFPSFLTLKKYIKEKKISISKIVINIGHNHSFKNSWREDKKQSGGGTLIDNGIHGLCFLYEIDDSLILKNSNITQEYNDVESNASLCLSSKHINDIQLNATWSKDVGYANIEIVSDDLRVTARAFDDFITIKQNNDEFKIYSEVTTNSITLETEVICNELLESKNKRITNIEKVKVVQGIIDQAYSMSLEMF